MLLCAGKRRPSQQLLLGSVHFDPTRAGHFESAATRRRHGPRAVTSGQQSAAAAAAAAAVVGRNATCCLACLRPSWPRIQFAVAFLYLFCTIALCYCSRFILCFICSPFHSFILPFINSFIHSTVSFFTHPFIPIPNLIISRLHVAYFKKNIFVH